MIKNYLKIIFRNIKRNKVYSFINIMGLAIGMASTLFIFLWVQNELSFDRYHDKTNQIYRVTFKTDLPNYHAHFARCPYGWVNALPEEFPEILDLVRFSHELKIGLKYENKKFNENRFFYADPNIFEIFNFQLLIGDPQLALKNPNSIVLSEAMVEKYFGEQNPIGKFVTARTQQGNEPKYFTITGVFKNIPSNSHFKADFFASFDEPRIALRDKWSYIYILLNKFANPNVLEQKFPEFITKYTNSERVKFNTLHIQPLADIHLYSNLDREIEPNGDFSYIIIFTLVAVLILLIACINFINLSNARAAKRTIEIGIRKIIGADRYQLIVYFLAESIIYCLVALFFTILLVLIFLQQFNNLTGKTILPGELFEWQFLKLLIALPFIVGILAGSYTTFYLSWIKPISILKVQKNWSNISGISRYNRKFSLRNILVLTQFSISLILIMCCIITFYQYNFIIDKRLGSQKDQVIAIPNTSDPVRNKYQLFKNELLGHPNIVDVSASMEEPSKEILDAFPFDAEGAKLKDENTFIHPLPVDNNFLNFFNLNLISGEKFSVYSGENVRETYILNETAVKMMGWNSANDAIGKNFKPTPTYASFEGGEIIGVVKDFNFSSVRKKIKPIVLFQRPNWHFCFLIKVKLNQISPTLDLIENKWEKINPEYPFEYYFVDELFNKIYQAEEKQAIILAVFSILGIIIACLGLFGLTAFTLEQRIKEIGIRKVLGASISRLFLLLSKDYTKWIVVANMIAWPVAWFVMKNWLQNFAYRIEPGFWIFLVAGSAVLFIALATISVQVIKASVANPVNAMRYE
jgi:putative ABC transport system permease protein